MSEYPRLKAYFPESLTMYQQIKVFADSGYNDEYFKFELFENLPYDYTNVPFGTVMYAYHKVKALPITDEEKSTLLTSAIKEHIKFLSRQEHEQCKKSLEEIEKKEWEIEKMKVWAAEKGHRIKKLNKFSNSFQKKLTQKNLDNG